LLQDKDIALTLPKAEETATAVVKRLDK